MPLLDDPDVPWHLAAGKLMLATHKIPQTDPWSFASNGAPWYLLSWLWDVLLATIEKITGVLGVLVFTCALFATLIATLACRLTRMRIDIQAILLTIMMATLCMVEFATARPHLAGYVIILGFIHILDKSRATSRYGCLWLLPPLMLIWANSHGSFIAGFTILGAYGIEALARKNIAWLIRLAVISAGCVIASLINPYSADILSGAMQSIDSDLRGYIIEWQPFTFGKSIGLSVWIIIFVLASNMRNNDIPLADKILSVMWMLATLMIMRNGAIFVLVSTPYIASCLDVQTRDLREQPKPSKLISILERQRSNVLWVASLAGALLFMAYAALTPHDQRIRSEARSLEDVVAYIESHEPQRHYLSDFDFGGQIIYYAAGKIQFFMDSRSNTAYASREMKNYLSFVLLQNGWEDKIKAYGVNGIIAHNQSKFAKSYADGQFHDRWHLVFAGNLASVYIAAP